MGYIEFNKPYFTGKEITYIKEAIDSAHVSGNGRFTKLCQNFFVEKWNFKKCLFTTSCTDALEMCTLLINLKAGDEVIIPSFTFPSTALAFERQGAKIVFIDSKPEQPSLDEDKIEELITPRTKAIVVVHYAGISCDMDKIMAIAKQYNLWVIEDAAQAIDSYFNEKPLGGIGHLGCFSFHDTKNVHCGEGGMLVINDEQFIERSEIIWEKGTNRAAFFRGEVDKYQCIDQGSSFLPSELLPAFLWAQLEQLNFINKKRKDTWCRYYDLLSLQKVLNLPVVPGYAAHNSHIFYVVARNIEERKKIIRKLNEAGIKATFHYQSLHKSPFFIKENLYKTLPNCDHYSDCLIRLPIYYELENLNVELIVDTLRKCL